jgi:nucleoside-diphosphate-sugar epimerase
LKIPKIKILITGSNGFLGRNLYKHLKTKQGFEVTGIDKDKSSTVDHCMDLSTLDKKDLDLLDTLVLESSVVYHFAASVGVDNIDIINSYMIDHNMLSLLDLYKPKVIYSSSSELYGDNLNAKETDNIIINPSRGGYPAQKFMTEQLLKALEIPHICVRFFNIIGPGQSAKQGFVIPRFIESINENKNIEVYQNSTRSFMDVRDAVQVLELLMFQDTNQTINIGNPENKITMLELAQLVKDVFNSESEIVLTNKREKEIKYRSPSVEKMNEIYTPKYSLQDTLEYIRINK